MYFSSTHLGNLLKENFIPDISFTSGDMAKMEDISAFVETIFDTCVAEGTKAYENKDFMLALQCYNDGLKSFISGLSNLNIVNEKIKDYVIVQLGLLACKVLFLYHFVKDNDNSADNTIKSSENVYGRDRDIDQLALSLDSVFGKKPYEGKLSDLKGLEAVKRNIKKSLIYPRLLKELYKIPNGEEEDIDDEEELQSNGEVEQARSYFSLSFGPPGTGKSQIGHASANELGIEKIYSIGAEFFHSAYIGDSDKNIAAFFKMLRQNKGRSVAILDEVDSILREDVNQKGGSHDLGKATFLREMDPMLPENKGLIIFATTNNPQTIRKAFFRRFDNIAYHSMPNKTVSRMRHL